MKSFQQILLLIFICLSEISFCQDTAINTFKIKKIYATAAGITGGRIERKELTDSCGIMIHGCDSCYVLGFKITGKCTKNPILDSASLSVEINPNNIDSISRTIDPRWAQNEFLSKNDRFTLPMKKYIWNTNNFYLPYYIEISDITIVKPGGQEVLLDKLCFFFK